MRGFVLLLLCGCTTFDGVTFRPDGGTKTSEADMRMAYGQDVLADGPIAYWHLDETSGTVAKDITDHGHDCTYQKNAKLGVPGVVNGSIDLDGKGAHVACGDAPFDFAGTTPFSIEVWIRPR